MKLYKRRNWLVNCVASSRSDEREYSLFTYTHTQNCVIRSTCVGARLAYDGNCVINIPLTADYFRCRITAAEEEKKVRVIEEDVSIKAKICEADLRKAEPSLVAANEALNTLNKNNLTELKSFGMPPKAVINVCAAVLVLFSGSTAKIPKDRSWRACKVWISRFILVKA